MTPSAKSEFRNQLFIDLYEGRQPKRIPEKLGLQAAAVLQYCGYDLKTAQYGTTKLINALDRMNSEFDTDNMLGSWPATPYWHKILGGITREMGDTGFIQHRNVEIMYENEYDQLIADPFKFLWETIYPRVYSELGKPAPYNAIALVKAMKAQEHVSSITSKAFAEISAKYDKVTANLSRFDGTKIPFDYIADFLRAFTGASIDIRRQPGKVMEALEVLTPYFISDKFIKPMDKPDRTKRAMSAPHMGTFLKPKDFEKFWWPGFKAVMWARYNAGYHCNIFCEDDWTPYLDYFDELPDGCELQFEKGDPKVFKERLGKKHILSGFYDCTLLNTSTKEQVVDKAKELMDILAPGGNFVFNFDKSILVAKGINWDNFKALIDCIHTYGKY